MDDHIFIKSGIYLLLDVVDVFLMCCLQYQLSYTAYSRGNFVHITE